MASAQPLQLDPIILPDGKSDEDSCETFHPLVVEAIPESQRILPYLSVRLVDEASGLSVPGHFTEAEAQIILELTATFDFTPDKKNRPACAVELLLLLESLLDERHTLKECQDNGRQPTDSKLIRGTTRRTLSLPLQ